MTTKRPKKHVLYQRFVTLRKTLWRAHLLGDERIFLHNDFSRHLANAHLGVHGDWLLQLAILMSVGQRETFLTLA